MDRDRAYLFDITEAARLALLEPLSADPKG